MTKEILPVILCLHLLSLPFTSFAFPHYIFDDDSESPITICSDRIVYNSSSNTLTLEGNIRLTQGNMSLTCDEMTYDLTANALKARGDLTINVQDDIITADSITIDVRSQHGIMLNARIELSEDGMRMEGRRIERVSDNTFIISDGTFTTCKCPPPSPPVWHLGARKANITIGGYGTLKGGTFNVKKRPILYLPYAVFPVKTERETGLLVPRLSLSSTNGFGIRIPFFWAIDKNMDATISPVILSRRGIGAELEYRYILSLKSRGTFEGAYLRENLADYSSRVIHKSLDKVESPANKDPARWSIRYRHDYQYSSDLYARARIYILSDSLYLSEFGDRLDDRSMPYTRSNLITTKRWSNSSLDVNLEYLQDLTQGENTHAQRIPEISFHIFRPRSKSQPLNLSLSLLSTSFFREGVLNNRQEEERYSLKTQRAILSPMVQLPVDIWGIAYMNPSLGYDQFLYRSPNVDDPYSQFVVLKPMISLSTEIMRLYPLDSQGIRKMSHSIEPSVTYRRKRPYFYSSRDLKNKRPRIIEVHHLDGIDRSTEEDVAQIMLTNKLIKRYKGKGGLTQYLKWLEMKITQEYDFIEERPLDSRVELSLTPNRLIIFETRFIFDPFYDKNVKETGAILAANHPRGHSIRLDLQYNRPPDTGRKEIFLSPSIRFLPLHNLDVSLATKYTYLRERPLEQEVHMKYTSICRCWDLDISLVHRLQKRIGKDGAVVYDKKGRTILDSDVTLYFYLTLKGLGTIGK